MPLDLHSTAFQNNVEIPSKYTCEGNDVSPPLSWSGAPAGTKSFALIVSDPDAPDPKAPRQTWTHWVLFNVPATLTALPEGVKPKTLAKEIGTGRNDFGHTEWGGPCPPIGRHRYFFKLYALDTTLDASARLSREELEVRIKDHVLASAELMGTYEKKKK